MKSLHGLAAAFAMASFAAQSQVPAGDAARGKSLYMKNLCYTCHGTVGQGGDRGSGGRMLKGVRP
jgi:mono/diheme cytochrome c family protein